MISDLEAVVALLLRAKIEKVAPQLLLNNRIVPRYDLTCGKSDTAIAVIFKGDTFDELLVSLDAGMMTIIEQLLKSDVHGLIVTSVSRFTKFVDIAPMCFMLHVCKGALINGDDLVKFLANSIDK